MIKDINEIMNKLEACLKDVPAHPTHLDIKLDHIFIDEDKAVFIDLDAFALSDPVIDPASFLIQMEMFSNLSAISNPRFDALAQTFLREYFTRVPGDWYERLSANYSCAALKAAVYYIQHQEPSWPRLAAMTVNRAVKGIA